jgi:hypothetical protein
MKAKITIVIDVVDEPLGVIQACKVEKKLLNVMLKCKMEKIVRDSFIQPIKFDK